MDDSSPLAAYLRSANRSLNQALRSAKSRARKAGSPQNGELEFTLLAKQLQWFAEWTQNAREEVVNRLDPTYPPPEPKSKIYRYRIVLDGLESRIFSDNENGTIETFSEAKEMLAAHLKAHLMRLISQAKHPSIRLERRLRLLGLAEKYTEKLAQVSVGTLSELTPEEDEAWHKMITGRA